MPIYPFTPPFAYAAEHTADDADPARCAVQAVSSEQTAGDTEGDQIGEEMRLAELGAQAAGAKQWSIGCAEWKERGKDGQVVREIRQ